MFKRFVFFLLIVGAIQSFAQKDSVFKISHCVGGGAQWLSSISYNYEHDNSEIHYNAPTPYIFYRFILSGKKEKKLCFTLNGYKRSGNGSHSGGSLGGGNTISGTFDFLRLDIGVNRFWSFGRKKGTSFGIGASLGFITYIEVNMTNYGRSAIYGPTQTTASAYDAIRPVNRSLNCELNQQIKLNKSGALLIGIRALLESPDGFLGESYGSYFHLNRAGKVITTFLAYRFGNI